MEIIYILCHTGLPEGHKPSTFTPCSAHKSFTFLHEYIDVLFSYYKNIVLTTLQM